MSEADDIELSRPPRDLPAEQQAETWRAVFEALPIPALVHGPDGDLSAFSAGALELLGYSKEEMRALKPFGWVDPAMMRGAAGRLETILYDGILVFESAVVRKDGTTVPTEVHSQRVDTPLGPAILSVIRDVSEREGVREQLVHLAYHDSLTGLWNRVAFEDHLRVAIADVRRHGDVLALAYLDLDRFKPINDQYGHHTGDEVLATVGRRIQAVVRTQDFVARLGGDEFVILLARIDSESELGPLAERLLDNLRVPIRACGVDCVIAASIGFAVFDPQTDDARSIVVKADAAMYAAKSDPDHAWCVWSPALVRTQTPGP